MAEQEPMNNANVIAIGTRGSDLALAQAEEVRDRLIAAHGTDIQVRIDVISTKGDRVTDRPLSEIGGKGLFTEEIEERLSDGRIDIAVHSTKDMPTILPEGLALTCFLPREAPEDAFISKKAKTLDDLPKGAVVGTSSLRRKALLLRLRPDLEIVEFRGNVQTRLKKLENGVADATLLAAAGLNRLGQSELITSKFSVDKFPPAPGQGAICIEARIGDQRIADFLTPLNDENTTIALAAERAFLRELDGSCRTPLAGHARIKEGVVYLHGMILTPDGKTVYEHKDQGAVENADAVGVRLALNLRERADDDFFETWNR